MKCVNLGQVLNGIDNFVDDVDAKTLQAFQYVGEEFVRSARLNREFEDDTGNLQSSIGYVIAKGGKILYEAITGLDQSFQDDGGRDQGLRLAEAVVKDNSTGWVLVGLAGMEYGIYVEARGINVISFSVPGAQKSLQEILDALT